MPQATYRINDNLYLQEEVDTALAALYIGDLPKSARTRALMHAISSLPDGQWPKAGALAIVAPRPEGAPPACPECTVKDQRRLQCEGMDRLRRFESWNDLAGHLSEEMILHAVNTYQAIFEDYERLKEQENDRRSASKARQLNQKALVAYAKENLSQDELTELRERAERKAGK